MMDTATILTFGDVKDTPRVMKVVPGPLRIGDHVHLQFLLKRKLGTRSEELHVSGEFRVTQVSFDTRGAAARQLLTVESVGIAPMWRAVKTQPAVRRKLSPARSPRTVIG